MPDAASDWIETVPEPIDASLLVLNIWFNNDDWLLLSAVAKPLTPVKLEPSPEKDVAVTTPVTTIPFSALIALFAFFPTILSTLNRPSVDPPPNVPSGLKPKTSGIKSSPSDMIKSAPLPTLISAYCVYAADAEAGVSTVTVEFTGKTVLV